MNIIACHKDCKHQQEGYCNLKMNAVLGTTPTDNCCYYTPLQQQLYSDYKPQGLKRH